MSDEPNVADKLDPHGQPTVTSSTADLPEPLHGQLRTLPSTIGAYRILALLGEGGMGTVYKAEQQSPHRIVALKIIKPGVASEQLLRRFEQEAEALGRLQHPGIAQIYEAGTADSGSGLQPYFAMEFIQGRPLIQYAAARRLDVRGRLELLARLCDAVNHAHQRGIIHRDLKPGNILVDEAGQPKILDFGVARVTDSDTQATRQTDLGQLIGTLAYMSPEQVLGNPLELDLRSDVYALGVILYELLAGKLPYKVERKALHEAVQVIREEDPTPLSSIQRSYRGDIETIVAKALEKDKARRYAAAADLAGDIRRYLTDEPIVARPPSAGYQLQKFARRHKALMAGTAAVFLVLVAGVVASTWQAVRARRAERSAVEQRDVAVTEKRRADAEAAASKAVNDFLQNDLLAQASTSSQSGLNGKPDPDLKVRTAIDRAAARITGKFEQQPGVEAAIRDTMGQTYMDLGLYPEARKQLERALDLHRRFSGAENPKALGTMSHLARAEELQGKYAEAEALLNQTVPIMRRVLGAEHPDTLAAMTNLATAYDDQGKYPQAEVLYGQTLEIRRRVLGPEHRATLNSLNGLANAYSEEGKYAQAEPLYNQQLEISRRVLGPEHPNTLLAMSNLALNYDNEGKFAEAEALLRQTVEIRRQVLGPEHPETLMSMQYLGGAYSDQGNYAQAEKIFSQTWEIRRRVLGAEHPDTLLSMTNLAFIYHSEGKYAQAEALGLRTLEIMRRALGPEHPDTLWRMNNLANVYSSEGKYAQADALFKQTLEARLRVLGPDHPNTLSTLSSIASNYQRQGNYALAETYASQAVAGRQRTVGKEDPDTLAATADLALARYSQGKFAESEPLAREVLESERKVQPDDWERFNAESLLGASLAGQKKYAEAEPLLLEGYKGMLARKDRIAVPDWYYIDRSGDWIVKLYQAWGKPEKATEWAKD
jgi:tetratricopeptide (TPR) repeat protein/predicted Ser/Thr protein kinase